MNETSRQCCICHGNQGELQTFIRWPGAQREYCELDWIRFGQYRAQQDMAPVRLETMEAA